MGEPVIEIDPAAEEPQLLAFVREYWHRQKGSRELPRRSDSSPSEMKAHLRHILLADVINGGEDFQYRLVGTELHRYFDGNPTGKRMSEVLAAFGKNTVDATLGIYREVIRRRAPVRVRGSGSYFDQGPKFVDALFAPLSDDGETVNMIFGTFMFVWDMNRQFTHQPEREIEVGDLKRALEKSA